MEKHLVETGHTRSVISFCEECWKAVVSISHHCHISCSSSLGFFKKSDNIRERKINAGRLRAEDFCLLSAFWTPRQMPLSTDLETGRAGLCTNHLLRKLKMGFLSLRLHLLGNKWLLSICLAFTCPFTCPLSLFICPLPGQSHSIPFPQPHCLQFKVKWMNMWDNVTFGSRKKKLFK